MNNFNTQRNDRSYLFVTLMCMFLFAMVSTAQARQGLLLQVSDDNPRTWNIVLNIAKKVPKNFQEPIDVVVVAFGPGLKMLTKNSKVANRLKDVTGSGVEFRACGETMKKLKLNESDLYSSEHVKRVKGGVVEIIRLQNAGYTYVRP